MRKLLEATIGYLHIDPDESRSMLRRMTGDHEARTMSLIMEAIMGAIDGIDEKDCVFYDIGACIGYFSVYAARLGARVYSFEPHIENSRSISLAMAANGFQYTSKQFTVALGKDNCFSDFYLSESSGQHSFDARATGRNYGVASNMPVFKLDTIVSKMRLPLPDVVKIDAEGLELDIIEGGKETLRNATVIVDVHPWINKDMFPPEYKHYGRLMLKSAASGEEVE